MLKGSSSSSISLKDGESQPVLEEQKEGKSSKYKKWMTEQARFRKRL